MISYHILLPYNQDQGPEEVQILIEGRNGDEKRKLSEECCLPVSKSQSWLAGLWHQLLDGEGKWKLEVYDTQHSQFTIVLSKCFGGPCLMVYQVSELFHILTW